TRSKIADRPTGATARFVGLARRVSAARYRSKAPVGARPDNGGCRTQFVARTCGAATGKRHRRHGGSHKKLPSRETPARGPPQKSQDSHKHGLWLCPNSQNHCFPATLANCPV